jgi:hypothetical protein
MDWEPHTNREISRPALEGTAPEILSELGRAAVGHGFLERILVRCLLEREFDLSVVNEKQGTLPENSAVVRAMKTVTRDSDYRSSGLGATYIQDDADGRK